MNKSRRTSPSPFISGQPTSSLATKKSTHSTVDNDLTGSSDDEFEDFDREFFKRQQQAEQRIEREKLDAEFARKVQEGYSDYTSSDVPQSSGPSAFDRISGVRPPPTSHSTVPFSTASSSQIQRPPGSYPDDDDDDYGDWGDSDLDSDLEVIPSSEFHSNVRQTQQSTPVGGYYSQQNGRNRKYPWDNRNSERNGSQQAGYNSVYNGHVTAQMKQERGIVPQSGYMAGGNHMVNGYGGAGFQNPFDASSSSAYSNAGGAFRNPSMFATLSDVISRTASNLYDQMPNFLYDERYAGQVDYIVNDPRKTTEEIKALLENIRPDTDLPAENREGTPDGLKYPLVCVLAR